MTMKWYKSRNNQAAMIGGACVVLAAIITAVAMRSGDRSTGDGIIPDSAYVTRPETSKAAEAVKDTVSTVRQHPAITSRLHIVYDLDQSQTDSVIKDLRDQLGVRGLMPLEHGTAVGKLPHATRFYVEYYWMDDRYAGRDSSIVGHVNSRGASRRKGNEDHLEFVKLSDDDIRMFGFITAETASRLTNANRTDALEFILSTVCWNDFDCLVLLPVGAVCSATPRNIDTDEFGTVGALDMAIEP